MDDLQVVRDRDAARAEERKIGPIAREREDEVVRDLEDLSRRLEDDAALLDPADRRLEVRADRALLDAVLDVGPQPVLHARPERGLADGHRDADAVPVEVERRFDGGVLSAHDEDVRARVRERLGVVVRHLREVLAGNAEEVRVGVEAGRHDDGAGRDDAARGRDAKETSVALDREDALVKADREPLALGHLPVVDEALAPRGLPGGGDERMAADLEQLGSREEDRVRGPVARACRGARLFRSRRARGPGAPPRARTRDRPAPPRRRGGRRERPRFP